MMIIKTVKFKKDVDSKWEAGISIESNGNSDGMIIDSKGNVLVLLSKGSSLVYDIKDLTYDLCLDLEPILESINQKI